MDALVIAIAFGFFFLASPYSSELLSAIAKIILAIRGRSDNQQKDNKDDKD